MLNIFNNLAPFFEDSYRLISVREYAKLILVSPPTASKLLKEFTKKGYLQQRAERGYLLFTLRIENEEVVDLSRLYWKWKLREVSKAIQAKLVSASGILFGSLVKAEVKPESDIDIAIFALEKKALNLKSFEESLGRKISLHWFKSLRDIKNEHLSNNIINGVVLFGKVKQ